MLTEDFSLDFVPVLYDVESGDKEKDSADHFHKTGGEQRILKSSELDNVVDLERRIRWQGGGYRSQRFAVRVRRCKYPFESLG